MGAPHPHQINGIGGGDSILSKTATLSKSSHPDAQVDYLFPQVNPNSPIVDYASNRGNMLSAVGPFAIEKGLVAATEPMTEVQIFNVNTDSVIRAEIQTPGGKVTHVREQNKEIAANDRAREVIDDTEVNLIDVAVPAMIVSANFLSKSGWESKAELDADAGLIARLNVATACRLPGSVVADLVGPRTVDTRKSAEEIAIEHPTGEIKIELKSSGKDLVRFSAS